MCYGDMPIRVRGDVTKIGYPSDGYFWVGQSWRCYYEMKIAFKNLCTFWVAAGFCISNEGE